MTPFFDTNLLIYAQQSGDKGRQARALLAAGGVISVQVINEFASVAYRKLGKSWSEIEAAIDDVLALVDPPLPLTLAIAKAARALAHARGFSFYDALIVAAALDCGCETLLSEDMQNGQQIGSLTIINPCLSG